MAGGGISRLGLAQAFKRSVDLAHFKKHQRTELPTQGLEHAVTTLHQTVGQGLTLVRHVKRQINITQQVVQRGVFGWPWRFQLGPGRQQRQSRVQFIVAGLFQGIVQPVIQPEPCLLYTSRCV